MTARKRRSERRRQIVAVCEDLRTDSMETPHGLDPVCFHNVELFEIVKDCTGFDYLSEPEQRLAVVAFTEGSKAAKESVWYA